MDRREEGEGRVSNIVDVEEVARGIQGASDGTSDGHTLGKRFHVVFGTP